MQKLKNVQKYAKISDTPFDQRSLIHREAWFPPCFVRQNQQKKITFFARRFQTTSKLKCSNLRPLLSITFPQGFRISKNIGHPTSGSGGKNTFKRYLKSEQTHTHTNIWTFRLIESIGPEGRCFEKLLPFRHCPKGGSSPNPKVLGQFLLVLLLDILTYRKHWPRGPML